MRLTISGEHQLSTMLNEKKLLQRHKCFRPPKLGEDFPKRILALSSRETPKSKSWDKLRSLFSPVPRPFQHPWTSFLGSRSLWLLVNRRPFFLVPQQQYGCCYSLPFHPCRISLQVALRYPPLSQASRGVCSSQINAPS